MQTAADITIKVEENSAKKWGLTAFIEKNEHQKLFTIGGNIILMSVLENHAFNQFYNI